MVSRPLAPSRLKATRAGSPGALSARPATRTAAASSSMEPETAVRPGPAFSAASQVIGPSMSTPWLANASWAVRGSFSGMSLPWMAPSKAMPSGGLSTRPLISASIQGMEKCSRSNSTAPEATSYWPFKDRAASVSSTGWPPGRFQRTAPTVRLPSTSTTSLLRRANVSWTAAWRTRPEARGARAPLSSSDVVASSQSNSSTLIWI